MPTALIVIGAVILGICALLLLRVRLVLICSDARVLLQLRVLCFRFNLYPKKPPDPRKFSPEAVRRMNEKKMRKAAKKAKKKQKRSDKKQAAKTAGGGKKTPMTLKSKLLLVKVLLRSLLRATGKHLHLKAARLHVIVATGDAATTAIAYGAISGVMAGIISLLERAMRLHARPPQAAVIADFIGERPRVDIKLCFSMRMGGALLSLFSIAFSFLFGEHRRKRKKSPAPSAPSAEAT